MYTIDPQIIKTNLCGLQSNLLKALFEQVLRAFCSLKGAWPCKDHHFFGHKPFGQADQGLERWGSRFARLISKGFHQILANLLETDLGEVNNTVRTNVIGGVSNFVEQLLFASRLRHDSTRVRELGKQYAIVTNFCDRVTNICQIRNVFITRITKIAATELAATFHQMSDHHPLRHQLIVVKTPVKLIS